MIAAAVLGWLIGRVTALLPNVISHSHGKRGGHGSWLALVFSDWRGPQTATILAAFIAIAGVAATIRAASSQSRRDRRASLYADALGGVADYLEGPYRIRRKDGSGAHRNSITAGLSDVKSSIDHSQELLRLNARRDVADFFDDYVLSARIEAGPQMRDAWTLPSIAFDDQVNLGKPYERSLSKTYREQVLRLMQADLEQPWWWHWPTRRYRAALRTRLPSPQWPSEHS